MKDYEKLMSSEEFDTNLDKNLITKKEDAKRNFNADIKKDFGSNKKEFNKNKQPNKNYSKNYYKPAHNSASKNQNITKHKIESGLKETEDKTEQILDFEEDKLLEFSTFENQSVVSVEEKGYGKKSSNLKIMFLGGIGEIGKNMTVFEYGDDIFVLDCGLMFPNGDMLGIDLVIPDYSYLVANQDKIRGIVITHGHEDHIGGLPYVLKDIKAPVYASRMTLELIAKKMEEHKKVNYKTISVKSRQKIKLGCFEIEFINVNHSIAGSFGIAIHSPVGTIVHTGDFKVDFTPVRGEVLDFHKFADLGSKGVLLFMSDSTNAEREGFSMSEALVSRTLEDLFIENAGKRITVATFASNVYRLQEVMNIAQKYKRKVMFTGRSMINISDAANKIGEIEIDKSNLVEIDKAKNYPDGELCIISTGSQGEPMSALVRMAAGEFKGLDIGDNDVIIFSSSPIPGNERMVNNVINKLIMLGAKVIYNQLEQVHASGHACRDELKIMFSLLKPKFFIPVHGEQKHLVAHKQLAITMGVEEKNILMPLLGMKAELGKNSLKFAGSVPFGSKLIDGAGIGELQSNVLRERKQLSEDGLCIVILSVNTKLGTVARPEIVSRGFTYVGEAESWLNEAKDVIVGSAESVDLKGRDYQNLKLSIKKSLTNYLSKKLRRKPLIVPIILES